MATNGEAPKASVAFMRGSGTPQTVISTWQGVLSDFPELVQDLQRIREVVDSMSADDSGWRVLASIACSILNRKFLDTGVLYNVDEEGDIGWVIYAEESQRKMVWMGLVNQ